MAELDFNGFFDALPKRASTPIWVSMCINIFGCAFKSQVSPESYNLNFAGKTTPFEMRVELKKEDGTVISKMEISAWHSLPTFTELKEIAK